MISVSVASDYVPVQSRHKDFSIKIALWTKRLDARLIFENLSLDKLGIGPIDTMKCRGLNEQACSLYATPTNTGNDSRSAA